MFYLNDIFLLRPGSRMKVVKYEGLLAASEKGRPPGPLQSQSPEVSVIAYLFTKSSAGVGPFQ